MKFIEGIDYNFMHRTDAEIVNCIYNKLFPWVAPVGMNDHSGIDIGLHIPFLPDQNATLTLKFEINRDEGFELLPFFPSQQGIASDTSNVSV